MLTGNNGTDNAIAIQISGLSETYTDTSGQVHNESINLPFSSFQKAVGESATADTLVYDSLGTSVSLRLTTVLESRDSSQSIFRWFADSTDNSISREPSHRRGNGDDQVRQFGELRIGHQFHRQIDRNGYPARPLTFNLDFSQITGLSTSSPNLAVSSQDGFASGTLSSYIIGEDGKITGVFSTARPRPGTNPAVELRQSGRIGTTRPEPVCRGGRFRPLRSRQSGTAGNRNPGGRGRRAVEHRRRFEPHRSWCWAPRCIEAMPA